MPDGLTQGDRYRKVATEASNLAKNASSDFLRRYYERLAKRYLLLAEAELAGTEKNGDAVPVQLGSSSGGEDREPDAVALVPSQEIGPTIPVEEAELVEKLVESSDPPQTVPKRRKPTRSKKNL
jgi:hypothetical protein